MLDNSKRQPVECFSRSMGFIRPISNFNIGKRQEFEDRALFKENLCLKA
ncbi:MAG: anaerobic ribonucleoside-triphosphate reductase [Alphaproteobacteria bacterium]|nr:anaerobic ribonucleoside-triphosphate reductase [Alphaproteobacteria bacterium]